MTICQANEPARSGLGGSCNSISPMGKRVFICDQGRAHPPPSRDELLSIALSGASVCKLKEALLKQIYELNIRAIMRVSAELTIRGVPPCFRFDFSEDGQFLHHESNEASHLMMLIDLQWIVSRYPTHKVNWKAAKALFNPVKFDKTADYLYWGGRRAPGQIATALGLTKYQQRECIWIQSLLMKRWRLNLLRRWPAATQRITADVLLKDGRPREAQDLTIQRRISLWLCGEFGDKKPQRTADFYQMLTGHKIPRNIVAKQLQKMPLVRRRGGISVS